MTSGERAIAAIEFDSRIREMETGDLHDQIVKHIDEAVREAVLRERERIADWIKTKSDKEWSRHLENNLGVRVLDSYDSWLAEKIRQSGGG